MVNLQQLPPVKLASVQGTVGDGLTWIILLIDGQTGNVYLGSPKLPFFCLFGEATGGLDALANHLLGKNYGKP